MKKSVVKLDIHAVTKKSLMGRSSHQRCSVKIAVLKNCAIFTPVLESYINKVAGLKACNFIKKKFQHKYFPVNIGKFLRTAANDCF